MGVEIERKFLVEQIPENISDYVSIESDQGYLGVKNPESVELRIRRKKRKGETTYLLAIKKGNGLQRDEIEIEVTEETYRSIWPKTEGKRIEKIRYEIPYNKHLIELDIYHGNLEGLLTAEVEFEDVEGSASFVPPQWFGREVTEDSRYKNKNLAIMGMPQN